MDPVMFAKWAIVLSAIIFSGVYYYWKHRNDGESFDEEWERKERGEK